jgi:Fe-S-cluster containining protein
MTNTEFQGSAKIIMEAGGSKMSGNPCEGCTVSCCLKMGLFLPKAEFSQHFQRHEESLVIRQIGKIFVVSPKEGQVCPYLDNGGCRIYHERPIDCRVYPYIMSHIIEKRNKVKIVFHTRSDCPKKSTLYRLMPESEARALIIAFGKKIYGESKTIIAHRESGMLSQFCNRFEARLSRSLNKMTLRWKKILSKK